MTLDILCHLTLVTAIASAQLLVAAAAGSVVPVALAGASRGGSRRRVVIWARASRALRRTAAPASVLLGGGLWLLRAGLACGAQTPWREAWLPASGLVVLGACSTAGCYLLLDAGRREARGSARVARREARLGGFLLPAGASGVVAPTLVAVASGAPALRSGLAGGAILALAAAAVVGLLAGLGGKPRPSAGFAAALYLAGLVALVASFEPSARLPLGTGATRGIGGLGAPCVAARARTALLDW